MFIRAVAPFYPTYDYPEAFRESFNRQIGSRYDGLFTINDKFKLSEEEKNALKSQYTAYFTKAGWIFFGATLLGWRIIRNRPFELLAIAGLLGSIAGYMYFVNKDDIAIHNAEKRSIVNENKYNLNKTSNLYEEIKGIITSDDWKNRNIGAIKDYDKIERFENEYWAAKRDIRPHIDALWASKGVLLRSKGLIVHKSGTNASLSRFYNEIAKSIYQKPQDFMEALETISRPEGIPGEAKEEILEIEI